MCLSYKDQSETPDAEEQRDLLLAGLGEVLEIRDLIILVLTLGVLIEAWLEFSIMRLAIKMS